jgi:prolyl-tRNA synthetase
MAHGDDRGLILPPKVAPIQVVVIPIVGSDEAANASINEAISKIEKGAGSVRVKVDRREGIRPGEKYAHWELRGVPLRLVIGAKDLAQNQVTVVRRVDGEETKVPLEVVASGLQKMLDDAQSLIKQRADTMLADRSREVATLDELKAAFEAEPVFANAPFCNSAECERTVIESVHAVSVRCLRDDRRGEGRPCLVCGKPSEHIALIARAY